MGSKKLEVLCPCCETKLQVDQKTGEVIWEERKPKPEVSLTDMVKGLEGQKKEQQNAALQPRGKFPAVPLATNTRSQKGPHHS